jgi:hypothetical protein
VGVRGHPAGTPVRYQQAHSQNIIISENIENSHINGGIPSFFPLPRDISDIPVLYEEKFH